MTSNIETVSHARIKFIDDDVIKIVNIEEIVEFKKNKPTHKNDFCKTKIYTVEYTDDRASSLLLLGAQISDLFGDYAEAVIAKTKRPVFAKLHNSDLQEYRNKGDEDSEESTNKEKEREISRKATAKTKSEQNKILQSKIHVLMSQNNLKVICDKIPDNNKQFLSNVTQNEDSNDNEIINLKDENTKLKRQVEKLERDLLLSQKKLQQTRDTLENVRILNEKLQMKLLNDDKCVNSKLTPKKVTNNVSPPNESFSWLDDFDSKVENSNVMRTSTPKTRRSLDFDNIGNDETENKLNDSNLTNNDEKKEIKDSRKIEGKKRKRAIISSDSENEVSDGETKDMNKNKKKQKIKDDVVDSQENNTKQDNAENQTQTDYKFLQKFTVGVKPNEVKWVSLGSGISMTESEFMNHLHSKTPSLFTKSILRSLYTSTELAVRSISGSKLCKTPKGVNIRKKMTPSKLATITKCLKYYLRKKTKLEGEALEAEVNKCNHYITEDINKIVSKMR